MDQLLLDATLKSMYLENYQKDINSIMENGHYRYAQWRSEEIDDDTIAQEIAVLLKAIDKCRSPK